MNYEVVMGLEVHVELATESKLFCSCSAKFGARANENVCPACAGMPGLLPVANPAAIDLGITAGLVTNCDIARVTTFDKKNYFYPDLPTGYQITQLFAPVCTNGCVEIETSEGKRAIRIKQIHIEEDAGKLVHEPRFDASLVDYNRAGVPLVEIVSQPDFRTAEEVIAYLEKLRLLLTFSGVSDCKMQEGSMRADINISVREKGSDTLGTRTEIKNMNSLKAIARAIQYESARHIEALETGCETLVQETRRWDDNKGESFAMRNKEDATDYRYFPNPDIMPIEIDDTWLNRIKQNLPELAHEKKERLMNELALPAYDCNILTGSKNLADIFDGVLKVCNHPKEVSNWILGELLSLSKTDNRPNDDITIDTVKFGKLINMVLAKTINRNAAKDILALVYKEGIDPERYAQENGLGMITDESVLQETVDLVLQENQKAVSEYKAGNKKAIGSLIGQVMKKTGGKADPRLVNELVAKALTGSA